MLRLSRLADYAVVVMLRLGSGGAVQTCTGIAAATRFPEPTVAKVLKMLAVAGLVSSQRGARGGYRMARSLETTSIADVITAVDGPIALTACVEGAASACEVSGMCALHGHWDHVNQSIRGALAAISLADLQAAPARVHTSAEAAPTAISIAAAR